MFLPGLYRDAEDLMHPFFIAQNDGEDKLEIPAAAEKATIRRKKTEKIYQGPFLSELSRQFVYCRMIMDEPFGVNRVTVLCCVFRLFFLVFSGFCECRW